MIPTKATIASLFVCASPLAAQEFTAITDKDSFLTLLDGRELRLGVLGISLFVNTDGTITGAASGIGVTGTWAWQDGYFCREMAWGETPIPYNCQLVEARGTDAMRFTVDQGAGESAVFNLR